MSTGHALPQYPRVPVDLNGPDAAAFVRAAALFAEQLCATPAAQHFDNVMALVKGLRQVPMEVESEARTMALVYLAQYCYVSGFAMIGIEPAVDALNCARRLGKSIWTLRALNVLATNLADTVDLSGAIEYYGEAIELAASTGDRRIEASLWTNLGGAMFLTGQFAEARLCHERCLALAKDQPTLLALAHQNLALIALHEQRVDAGLANVQRAIVLLADPRQPNDLLNRVLSEAHFARLLVEINAHERAAERVEIAKELAYVSGSLRAQHLAEVAEGLCEVARGQHDIGLSRLNALLDRARSMRTTLRDTLHALIAAYRYLDQPHRADVHVRELTFLARRAQTDYVRARFESLAALSPSGTATVPAVTGVLERLALQAETGADLSALHIYRVGALACALAVEIGLSDEAAYSVEIAGRLHDIGKWPLIAGMRASPTVASSQPVRERLKLHAEVGEELLSQVDAPAMSLAKEAARSHHERWDGLGYPDGIAGASIPLAARIVAIANAFDEIAFPARGRGTQSVDRALDDLVAGRATRFDPELVDAFVGMINRMRDEDPRWQERLTQGAEKSTYLRSRERIGQLLAQPARVGT